MQQRTLTLYRHPERQHTPRNINILHAAEHTGFNIRLAVWCTNHVGTMQCAYLFAAIGIGSIIGTLTGNILLALVLGSLSSYFLQLVLLPIIMVGQNVQGRKTELQSDEMFRTSQQSFTDIEGIMKHLSAQDEVALKIQQRIDELILVRLDDLLETDALLLRGFKDFQQKLIERIETPHGN